MTEENKQNLHNEEEIVVEPEELEEVEDNTAEDDVEVVGGVILLRTKEDGIIMQPYENLGIIDITVFAEYLKQLSSTEWQARIEGGQIED